MPKAYYSPEPITLSGNVCIAGVSVFSLQSITVTNEGGGTGCEGEDGGHITGTDTAYGNWQNDYNSTSRPDGTTDAGFAAVDGVDVGEEDELGRRDFDNSTDPQFVAEPEEADPGRTPITFPFDHKSQEGQADENRLAFLKEEAKRQESETGEDTYHPNSDDITDWPDKADDNTVVYIDAGDGGTINWQINKPGGGFGCSETDTLKGTLVIDGANFKATGNKKSFSGVPIVRGGVVEGGEFEGG